MKALMDWLNCRQQCWLVAGIVFLGFTLATLFQQGIFSNIVWILSGMLFVIRPVCPET